MLKKDLIKENAELKAKVQELENKPSGHVIQNCRIDMNNDEENIAIAEAVNEGMKALQAIAKQNRYGIHLSGNN